MVPLLPLLLLIGASSIFRLSPSKGAFLRSGVQSFASYKRDIEDNEYADYAVGKYFADMFKNSVRGSHLVPSSSALEIPDSYKVLEEVGGRFTELMLPHLKEAFQESETLSSMFGVSPDLSFDRPSFELEKLKRSITNYMILVSIKQWLEDTDGLPEFSGLIDTGAGPLDAPDRL
jgi:hypothetical protein